MTNKIKNVIIITILFYAILVVSGCTTKENTPIPDPPGTNTYIFRAGDKEYNLDLYKSIDEDGANLDYVWIRFGLSSSALNFGFIAVNWADPFVTGPYIIRYETGGEIVNLGKVEGLGSITQKPTTGWSSSSAAEVGNGYVVRFKHSSSYGNSSLPYYYARFYVTDFMNSTSGGIGYVKAKYQMNF